MAGLDDVTPEPPANVPSRVELAGDGPPATVRPAGPPPTVRPSSSDAAVLPDGPDPTVRPSGPGAPASAPAAERALLGLPSSLAGRFAVVREIPVSSGEADLLLVRSIEGGGSAGVEHVVKVYRRGLTLDPDVLGRIMNGDQTRVLPVHDFGESDDRWWELQTYVSAGSLADLIRREGPALAAELVKAVVEQLNEALRHLHADLDVVHRDLKPANVLVLERQPLRLVLSDFGLATVAGFSLQAASGSGTPLYFPPEVVAGFVGGRARDYWALGMMVAEMTLGRHPFAGLQQATVLHHLGLRPVDVSAVEDDRLNLLCRGLLVRDPDHRWGHQEVRSWAEGGSPPVAGDAAAHASAISSGFSSFTFLGRQYGDRKALAAALAGNWADGARLLAGAYQRQRMVNWLAQFPYDEGITDLLDGWDREDPSPDLGLVQLLMALDPELASAPFRGHDLAGDGLNTLATEVVLERGQGAASDVLGVLFEQRILSAYGSRVGSPAMDEIDARWHESVEEFKSAADAAREGGAPGLDSRLDRLAQARLLLDALDGGDSASAPDVEPTLHERARAAPWFADLCRRAPASPGHRLAMALLAPVAADQAATAEEERRREAAAAREREAEEGARRLRQRVARTRACLVPVIVVLGVGVVALAAVHLRLADLRSSSSTPTARRLVDAVSAARVLIVPYLALAAAGVALVRRSRSSPQPLEHRAMQAVCTVGSILFPLALPFSLRHLFGSLRLSAAPNQRDTRLRPRAMTAATFLVLYAVAVVLERRYETFTSLLGHWSPDARTWYLDSWPTALDPAYLAAHWSWTAVAAAGLAVAGFAFGVRSYQRRPAIERVAMQIVAVAGLAGAVLGTGAFLVAGVASWFVAGVLALVIYAVAMFLIMWAVLIAA